MSRSDREGAAVVAVVVLGTVAVAAVMFAVVGLNLPHVVAGFTQGP
ncbi:hypothetical protein [Pseudomonas aeruginosa]|nr:hypothetical protein [Pseudomonas aeruginosa]